MTELKTLKDLQLHSCDTCDEDVNKQIMKQEAIKWAKKIRYVDRFEVMMFMKFFNLTEDDLK